MAIKKHGNLFLYLFVVNDCGFFCKEQTGNVAGFFPGKLLKGVIGFFNSFFPPSVQLFGIPSRVFVLLLTVDSFFLRFPVSRDSGAL